MDDIKVLLAVFGLLGVLTGSGVNGEEVCRDDVICESIIVTKGLDSNNDALDDRPCCPEEGGTDCKECVQVRRGNIDMILAVPHGGIYTNFPFLDRAHGCHDGTICAYNHACYNDSDPTDLTKCLDGSCCLTDTTSSSSKVRISSDFKSNEVAYGLYNHILEKTERCPSIIVSMPHRGWLDVNRDDADGVATFGREEMIKIYKLYRKKLKALVDGVNGRPGILFDLHGHNKKDWTMIGSMMSASDLKNTTVLNSNADRSSLKLLVLRTGEKLSDLLQGNHSLGKYIEDETVNGEALEAVPSDMNPDPNGYIYYAAKNSPITNLHRDNINVLQIEMPSSGRKVYPTNYSIALGEAFLKFYEHYIDGCVRYPCDGTNSCSNEGDGFKCTCSNTDPCPASVVSESGLLQDVTCSGADAASGVQKVNMSPNKTSYNKGECILYTCKDDYKYRAGSLSRVCEDGSWSGNAPVCTACPVYDIDKAEKSPDNDSYDYHDEVTYSCRSGYEPNNMTVTCLDSGLWSKDLNLQCIDIDECNDNLQTCKNNGTCENLDGDFKCHCTEGYSGRDCGTDINPCDPDPCGDSTGIHGICIKQTNTTYKCDCDHRYIGTNCTEKLKHKKCDVKVPWWLTLNYLKDKFCSAVRFYWREGSWCCKDINECNKKPCTKKPGKCCINRKKDYACESHKKIGCLAKKVFVTLYDTRTTWVPAMAVVGSPAYFTYLLYSPMQFVIEAILRYAITAEVVRLLYICVDRYLLVTYTPYNKSGTRKRFCTLAPSPGSVDSMATIGFEDETTNVTKVVQDSIESANVSAQFAIGNIETVSVTCDLGQYIHNDTCVDCPIGKYSDLPFTPLCKPCLPGYFQDNQGQDQCKICPAGSFAADFSSITCIPCPVGHFSRENADTCTPCGPGTVAETEGLSSCSACNPGTAPNAVRSRCDDCSAGTFSENGLQCKGCPPGSVALPAQGSCTQCEAGTNPSSDFSLCEDCSAGTFSPSGLYCSPCISGTYSTPRSSNCTHCPAGYFPNSTQSGCSPCLPGSWSSSGDNECTPCEDGSVSGAGQSSCTKCEGGTEPNDQKSECQNCSAGSYSSNGVQCISCVSGTYSTTGSSSCTPCPAGYFPNSTQSGCSPCLPGSWSSSGDNECTPCEDGSVSGEGQSSCTKCDGGTEPNDQKSECQNCSAGSYSSNGVRCISCASGTYSTPRSSSCTLCPAGYFPNPNQSGCSPCLPGTWSNSGDHECKPCEDGYVSSSGQAKCTKCVGGTEPNVQKSECMNCSAGSYSPNGVRCIPCPSGTYSKPGKSRCTSCSAGFFPNAGQSGCNPCLPGSWSNSGDHECRRCPEGTFSIGGLPSCTECNAGTIPNTEQSQCENCSAGFNSSAGDATCSPCPRDRWSPPGSEFCSECKLGEITLKDQSGCVQNIAFNKTSNQKGNAESSSDEENPDGPGNAVDGDFYKFCSRTKTTHDPWWRVNLEGWFAVRTVVILPTEKCCGAELHDLVVYVKPKGKNIICGTYTGPAAPGERIYVHCAIPIVGERVEIKMLTNRLKEALVLCEVVVIGTPADEPDSSKDDSSEEGSKSTKESKESGKKSDSKDSGKESDSRESGEKSDSKESGEKSEKGGKRSGKKSKNETTKSKNEQKKNKKEDSRG